MLSNKETICPDNLLNVAHKKKGVKAGIVNAGKPLPMISVQDAVNENLIDPVFIGDKKEILKCAEDLKWDISKYEIIHEPIENNTAAIAAKLAKEENDWLKRNYNISPMEQNLEFCWYKFSDYYKTVNELTKIGLLPDYLDLSGLSQPWSNR